MNSDDKQQKNAADGTMTLEQQSVPDTETQNTAATEKNTSTTEKTAAVTESDDNGEKAKDTEVTDQSAENSANNEIDSTKEIKTPADNAEALTKDESNDAEKADNDGFEQHPQKKHRALKAVIYSSCVVAISVAIAFGILFSFTDYLGMFRADKTANVKIPDNANTQQIASILKSNEIIRNPLGFRVYVKISKKSGMKDGIYELNSQMSYAQIVQKLRDTQNRATVKVTIPEGYTLQRIGALLEKKDVCSKQDFLKAANSSNVKFDFQSEIPNNKNRFYRLEGYLFPDTYEFYLEQSADSVVKKMLDNFDNRFDSELRKEADSEGMTVDQAVTLASIIQTEAGKSSEMSKISSVFHNRLENGVDGVKKLQSDATVLYGTNVIKPVKNDAAIISAYNTYNNEGLTPGAICNPGLAALKAAVSPENTSYYFFVSDNEGNYYYAQTYAKHLKNVKKALKSGKANGTNVAS